MRLGSLLGFRGLAIPLCDPIRSRFYKPRSGLVTLSNVQKTQTSAQMPSEETARVTSWPSCSNALWQAQDEFPLPSHAARAPAVTPCMRRRLCSVWLPAAQQPVDHAITRDPGSGALQWEHSFLDAAQFKRRSSPRLSNSPAVRVKSDTLVMTKPHT